MSSPDHAQLSVAPWRRPLVFASVIAGLAVMGVIVNFLTWRSFTSTFGYGAAGEATVESRWTGLSANRTIIASGAGDIGSESSTYPGPLILFVVLAVVGAVLVAMAKAPRVGAVLVGVAGAVLAGLAGYRMTVSGEMLFGGPVDVDTFASFRESALGNAEVSTGAGAYLALVVGLLMIAFGVFAAIWPATVPAVQAVQHPYGAPQQHFASQPYQPVYDPHAHQQPYQPVYDPHAHQQPYPTQPPAWPGHQTQHPGHPGQPGQPGQPPIAGPY